jgi:hypothetical protein
MDKRQNYRDELAAYEAELRELEASGTMHVRVVKSSGVSWYDNRIGDIFKVYKKPQPYYHGPGYKCTDILGGITVTDCEVVE